MSKEIDKNREQIQPNNWKTKHGKDKEIDKDHESHGKKPLKDKNDDDHFLGSGADGEEKEIKASDVDPESGCFHKVEHKSVFAYNAQTACDKNGWILDYSIYPGDENDSRTGTYHCLRVREFFEFLFLSQTNFVFKYYNIVIVR